MRNRQLMYDGRSSGAYELQLTFLNSELDMLPPQLDEYRTIPGRDVTYHVPRELGNKELRVKFMCENNTLAEWEARRRQITAWLHSKEEVMIRYSDDDDHYFIGKTTKIDFPEGDYRVKNFWVTFHIHPFTYTDSITIESTDERIYVNYEDLYETPFVYEVTTTEDVYSFTFRVGLYDLSYDGYIPSGSTIVIDTRNFTTRVDGALKIFEVTGTYAFLQPGYNEVWVNVPGTRTIKYWGRSL